MAIHLELLHLLSDGRFHSGEALGTALGVSRAAIWKAVRAVEALGCDVQAVRGRGYRLTGGIELLERQAVRESLSRGAENLLERLEIHPEVDSTNRYLMSLSESPHGHVCLAESQSSGRGRRGRSWVSPFGRNIYLSVGWEFAEGPGRLTGLSLATAIAVVHALERVGLNGAGVKWPNDVLWDGAKLAGILLEMSGESNGPCQVVVGVGVNVGMPANACAGIDQPWADVDRIMPGIGRNRLAGVLAGELLLMLNAFTSQGFSGFQDEWRRCDVLSGQEVAVHFHDGVVYGRAQGIDESGALLLAGPSGTRIIQSGEVSLRPVRKSAV